MKAIKLILSIACIATLLVGCSTPSGVNEAKRLETSAKVAAYVGSAEYLKIHPDKKDAFVSASRSLLAVEQSETVDVATLLAIVNKLPLKELKSEHAVIAITAATIMLTDYAGSLQLDQLNSLKPVVKAIREGIDLALQ